MPKDFNEAMSENQPKLNKFAGALWALLSSIILFDTFCILPSISNGAWESVLDIALLGWIFWPISVPTCLIMAPAIFLALILYYVGNFKMPLPMFCFTVVGSFFALLLQCLFFGLVFTAPVRFELLPIAAILDGILIYCLGASLKLFRITSNKK